MDCTIDQPPRLVCGKQGCATGRHASKCGPARQRLGLSPRAWCRASWSGGPGGLKGKGENVAELEGLGRVMDEGNKGTCQIHSPEWADQSGPIVKLTNWAGTGPARAQCNSHRRREACITLKLKVYVIPLHINTALTSVRTRLHYLNNAPVLHNALNRKHPPQPRNHPPQPRTHALPGPVAR